MAEVHYLISDASKQVDVESHVLRYWEDELELNIPRNDMGHRYYTEYHIRLFRKIKELKEKGYQLKAIKSALNKMAGAMGEITITEDYMEEDMKAAWNEGPSREQSRPRPVEATRGQSKNRHGETVRPQSGIRAAEPEKGEPGQAPTSARSAEPGRVQSSVRAGEPGRVQPPARGGEPGQALSSVRGGEPGRAQSPARGGEPGRVQSSVRGGEPGQAPTSVRGAESGRVQDRKSVV